MANLAITPFQFGTRNLLLAALALLIVLETIVWMSVAIWPHSKWVAVAQVPCVGVDIAVVDHLDELESVNPEGANAD